MHNSFSCYKRAKAGNSDEQISIDLQVVEREEYIELRFSRANNPGPSSAPEKTEELTLTNLSEEQVLDIIRLLEKWIESESYPIVDIDVDGIQGVHGREESDGYGRDTINRENEFSEMKVSVSERDIKFSYWDEPANKWRDLSIPSAEIVSKGVPKDIENVKNLYNTFYDFFTVEYSGNIDYFEEEGPASAGHSATLHIKQIFNRFSEVVIPLKKRRGDREPLTMDDEANVQYLLHGLLKLHFDDVRREPYTERHSSVSPRIDFLVQNETIGIEVKRASPTRQERALRNELSEDKEQYRADVNIDTFLIFVYDPEKQIENKAEFEDSFRQDAPQMKTEVIVTR